MRKVFPFEISMAVKDRPKSFQFITLAMFLFSIAVIFIGVVIRVVQPSFENTADSNQVSAPYAGVTPSPVLYSIQK